MFRVLCRLFRNQTVLLRIPLCVLRQHLAIFLLCVLLLTQSLLMLPHFQGKFILLVHNIFLGLELFNDIDDFLPCQIAQFLLRSPFQLQFQFPHHGTVGRQISHTQTKQILGNLSQFLLIHKGQLLCLCRADL